MERLHRLALITFGLAFTLCVTPSSQAQDYCSLRVRVIAPDGRRFADVLVAVNEPNGRTLEKWQKSKQDVEFCDLGVSPVTVTVGLKGCNPIVVNGVRLFWQEPYTLKVIYDMEHCMRETPPPPKLLCQILFRVRDSAGEWIKNAELKFANSVHSKFQTDNAGRALFSMGLNDQIQGTASAPEHATKTFSVTCSESEVREELLVLEKNKGSK
jgi:hypothetical protein